MRNALSLCLILAATSLTSCGAKEIDSCNSDRVKSLLLANTFQKHIDERISRYREALDKLQKNSDFRSQCNTFGVTAENARRCEEYKRKEYAEVFERTQSYANRATDALNKASASIENIRQTNYDGENNIRFCSADFVYTSWPQEFGAPYAPACSKAISYKIEPILDKPDQFYVSWVCR